MKAKSITQAQATKLRARLCRVESGIMKIVKEDCHGRVEDLSKKQSELIGQFLEKRQQILNEMFAATPEEIEQYRALNDHLTYLTRGIYRRGAALYRLALDNIEEDFDDDMMIQCRLRFCYQDEDSVLKLENDDYYCSRFDVMISLIDELYSHRKILNPIDSDYVGCSIRREHSHNMTDKELGFGDCDAGVLNYEDGIWREVFDGICVCYALHDLHGHKLYSIPDILRLNDFWCESKMICQSITEQTGKRHNCLAR